MQTPTLQAALDEGDNWNSQNIFGPGAWERCGEEEQTLGGVMKLFIATLKWLDNITS
jgi:hypothetical protein